VATHVKSSISFEIWFSYSIYKSGAQQAIGPVSSNSIGIYLKNWLEMFMTNVGIQTIQIEGIIYKRPSLD